MIKKLAVVLMIAGLVFVGTTSAMAALTVNFVEVDNSASFPGGEWVTTDITIDTDTDWKVAQILLQLDQGTIYNTNFFGGEFTVSAPPAGNIAVVPEIAFDTYVRNPISDAATSSPGAAVDIIVDPPLPLPRSSTFPLSTDSGDQQLLDFGWNNTDLGDIGNGLQIARITLSSDAQASGSFNMNVLNVNDEVIKFGLPIINGHIVPEPTSIALIGLGGMFLMTLAGRRRRR